MGVVQDASTVSGAQRRFPPGPVPAVGPAEPTPAVLRSCAEAEAYVASVCFKHGPPTLVGVELEWLLHRFDAPAAPVRPAELAAALGPHTPRTLDPASPALPLPCGSTVTVEPGGQVELASPPLAGLAPLVRCVRHDVATLHGLLADHGLRTQPRAADPLRPPTRVLDVPRYRAMEQSFDRIGPYGRSGMCSTAAVQVCLDAGEGADVARRWTAAHVIGPVLLGAFANSPLLHGRRTGWKSSRTACWLTLDPARTAPPSPPTGDPAVEWARRVLGTPLLCVRRDGAWEVPRKVTFADWVRGALPVPPTTADLDYHVSTLFPPVRAHGHLEVRYLDAQPGRRWALPTAVLLALMSEPAVTERAVAASAPAAGRWVSAARHGLADRIVGRAAVEVFELACAVLPGMDAPDWLLADLAEMTEQQVRRGRCPADDPAPGDAPGRAPAVSEPPGCADPPIPAPIPTRIPAPSPAPPEEDRA